MSQLCLFFHQYQYLLLLLTLWCHYMKSTVSLYTEQQNTPYTAGYGNSALGQRLGNSALRQRLGNSALRQRLGNSAPGHRLDNSALVHRLGNIAVGIYRNQKDVGMAVVNEVHKQVRITCVINNIYYSPSMYTIPRYTM